MLTTVLKAFSLLLLLTISVEASWKEGRHQKRYRKRKRARKRGRDKRSQRRSETCFKKLEAVKIMGTCKDGRVATIGNSCGTPPFVDAAIFGENKDTTGMLKATPTTDDGMNIKITLENLPKSDLVLTAWIVWVPMGVMEPPIFQIANHVVPCAPYTAGFTSGFGRDANEFKYTSGDSAVLDVELNFNPTYPGQGPLTRETFCFQKDVPGIQETALQQPSTPGGVFIPTSSAYLREYDSATGFEKLGPNGDPVVARSPVRAIAIDVIAHNDKTTHGLSQGVGGVDHYFYMSFPINDSIGTINQ